MSETIAPPPGPAAFPAVSPPPPAVERTGPGGRLYPVVWRWHFYAGLVAAPILWVVILTGTIYVFRTEISRWRDAALLEVVPRGERVSHDVLLEKAREAVESREVEGMAVWPDAARSVCFLAHADGPGGKERHLLIYFDPYTGEELGRRFEDEDFFAVVLELHRSLMLGSPGRILSELVTCWGVNLLATGVYLWWPRGKKNVGVWVPRTKGKSYAFLRDWHAVGGVYLAPLAALLMVTGLFFTIVLGTTFNASVKAAGHWPTAWFAAAKTPPPSPDAAAAPLDAVVASFLRHARPDDTVRFRFAAKPGVAHKGFLMRDEDKNSIITVDVDPYTGESVSAVGAAEVPFLYKVRLWAVSTHMGQIFGTPTKVLAFVTSLGLLALSMTGVWMWWLRRPRGRPGFPRRPQPRSLPAWGWGVIVLAGIVMPVAGVSMILIAGIDRLVGRWRAAPGAPRRS